MLHRPLAAHVATLVGKLADMNCHAQAVMKGDRHAA